MDSFALARRHGALLLLALGCAVVQPAAASGGHAHDAHAPAAAPTRTVAVRMDDTMRFQPDALQGHSGETLRLVVRNEGKLEHELVLGTEVAIREHARQMAAGTAHHAHAATSVTVAPGQAGELVVTLGAPGTLQMACLVPGHYEAGMRGTLTISGAHRH